MENNIDIINDIKNGCSKVQIKHFSKGETITTYIQNRKQICIIINGKADLIRYDLNGNQDIVDKFNAFDVFGEAFYPVNTNNELTVISTSKSEVMFLSHNDLYTKCKLNCKYHSNFSSNVLELILKNSIHQNSRIEVLSKRTIREKLLTYFTIISGKSFSKTFTLPFTLTDLADYLSVDRSAMMREIRNLIDEGFISKDGNKIKLLYK